MRKLSAFFSGIFLFILRLIQGLNILYGTLKLWTDPSEEGNPYLSLDRSSEKRFRNTQRKTWINRRWAIN